MSFRESTNNKQIQLRTAAIASVGALAVLLLSAVVFYKERMLFIDAPHILFRIINDGIFQINDFRYGSFVTQMVPYIGAKMHIPLQPLMILYSVSFYAFYLFVIAALVFAFRNYPLAILSGLYYTIFVSDTFYWPNNEIHQGVSWLLLSLGTVWYLAEKQVRFPLIVLAFVPLFFLSIWTHPLVVPTAAYLWGFCIISGRLPFTRVQSVILTSILLLFIIFKLKQGMHRGYDSTKIEVVTSFDLQKIKGIFGSPQWRFFAKSCVTNYWLFVVLSVVGLATLLYERRYLLFGWTIAVTAAYLLLIGITYWDTTASSRFYIESEYMPLTILCCTPFVFYTLPRFNSKVSAAVVIAIFAVRLLYIYNAAPPFQNRVAIMESVRDQMKQKGLTKVIIPEPVPGTDEALMMNWGAPVESFMISALHGEQPQRTFFFATNDEIKVLQNTGADSFLGCWERRPVSHLNKFYFTLDTASTYRVISFDSLMGK
jgi:hypothetical protein